MKTASDIFEPDDGDGPSRRPANAGNSSAILLNHLRSQDHSFSEYTHRVHEFMLESRLHAFRTSFASRIRDAEVERNPEAAWEGDLGWKSLTRALARDLYGRETGRIEERWGNGLHDPDLSAMLLYSRENVTSSIQRREDWISQFPRAVARTLTYIRLLPPPSKVLGDRGNRRLKLEGSDAISSISKYWELIVGHPHYQQSRNINQHCMDIIYDRYADDDLHIMKPSRVGWLRQAIRNRDADARAWTTTWLFFNIITQGRAGIPRIQIIWSKDLYSQIWEL